MSTFKLESQKIGARYVLGYHLVAYLQARNVKPGVLSDFVMAICNFLGEVNFIKVFIKVLIKVQYTI